MRVLAALFILSGFSLFSSAEPPAVDGFRLLPGFAIRLYAGGDASDAPSDVPWPDAASGAERLIAVGAAEGQVWRQ